MPDRRFHTALLAVFLLASASAAAQEVFQASWTVQDKRHDLQQWLARSVIARANDWLTREDNTAPTARLDDPLRVTVIVHLDPTTGRRTPTLARLVLGTIVIDSDFSQFLGKGTIDSLVHRNYYWRDETLTVVNEELWPYAAPNYQEEVTELDLYNIAFDAADFVPPRQLDLYRSTLPLTRELRLWAGFGFEEIGLPGLTSGTIRVGGAFRRLRAWMELPNSFIPRLDPTITGNLDGALGAGVSFENDPFGGALTFSDPSKIFGDRANQGDTGYVMSRSALFYFMIPIGRSPVDDGFLRLKLGPLYQQTVRKIYRDATESTDRDEDNYRLMARLEYAIATEEGALRRTAAAELLAGLDDLKRSSLVLSLNEQFSERWGMRLSLAAHGVLGERPPYLPSVSIMLSPTFTF